MAEDSRTDDVTATWTQQGWDRLLSVQRPVVLAHLRQIRRRNPAATPADVLKVLEKRYVTAVTAGGAASGAAAVVPGVGTVASLGISGAETIGFLEASALFAQSFAEVHGVATTDPVRSSTLVMALMLGPSGAGLVQQFAGEVRGDAPGRSVYWGETVSKGIPGGLMKPLADRVRRSFLKRFAARQGGRVAFRAVPFGIGAVVGGAGNRMAGKRVVQAAHDAFGPAPTRFPDEVSLDDPAKALDAAEQ